MATAALRGTRGFAQVAMPDIPQPTFTILTGIDLWRDGRVLALVLEAFAAQGLPVACVVDPSTGAETPAPAGKQQRVILQEHLARGSGLVQVIPYRRDLLAMTSYAMARAAYEVSKACIDAIMPSANGPLPVHFPAIGCAQNATPQPPDGLLAAGFKLGLVIPDKDTPVTGERWENGSVRVFGGAGADWTGDPAGAAPVGPRQFADISYLSLDKLETLASDKIKSLATGFAQNRLEGERSGNIALLAVSDMILRDDFGFGRQIALHLLRPDGSDAALQRSHKLLKAELVRFGFPFSESDLASEKTAAGVYGYWLPKRNPDGEGSIIEGLAPLKAEVSNSDAGIVPAGIDQVTTGFALRVETSSAARPGIDPSGALSVLAVSVEDILKHRAEFLDGALSAHDFVLVVTPQDAGFPRVRAQLLRLLQALDQDGVTEFRGLRNYGRQLFPRSKLISRHQITQADMARTGRVQAARTLDAQREAYMADARRAWSYIDAYTDRNTGLCASVVETTGGITKLETVTMWDVASQLNALPAAWELGIIDREEMDARIRRVLPNITGREIDRRRLPSEWIRTDRPHWGNRNFDACDTGRLLAALRRLSMIEGADYGIDDLVGSWNLDQIIIDGNLHSVSGDQLISVTNSHCAHYAALGFRHWGYAAISPYEVFEDKSMVDDRMRLLLVANKIGVLGAEPLLLEGCDYGLAPESDYLADVLLAAQIDAYERTGTLVAVSETPLDHSPWFSYQGLVLDRLRDEWRVVSTGDETVPDTPDFQHANLAISSKAAFLWAALRPGDYSDKLVAFVRQNGTAETGFVSGIYTSPARPMTNYTDLNTNAIILQAVWKRLAAD